MEYFNPYGLHHGHHCPMFCRISHFLWTVTNSALQMWNTEDSCSLKVRQNWEKSLYIRGPFLGLCHNFQQWWLTLRAGRTFLYRRKKIDEARAIKIISSNYRCDNCAHSPLNTEINNLITAPCYSQHQKSPALCQFFSLLPLLCLPLVFRFIRIIGISHRHRVALHVQYCDLTSLLQLMLNVSVRKSQSPSCSSFLHVSYHTIF